MIHILSYQMPFFRGIWNKGLELFCHNRGVYLHLCLTPHVCSALNFAPSSDRGFFYYFCRVRFPRLSTGKLLTKPESDGFRFFIAQYRGGSFLCFWPSLKPATAIALNINTQIMSLTLFCSVPNALTCQCDVLGHH